MNTKHALMVARLIAIGTCCAAPAHAAEHKLTLIVHDQQLPPRARTLPEARDKLSTTGETKDRPVPCRIHLQDQAGKAVRPPNLPFWFDHFVCTGRVEIVLNEGNYRYAIERGPEYERLQGTIQLQEPKELVLKIKRTVDLPAEGWWPGELHVHRPIKDVPLLMQAEDLYVAPVITWWNRNNPWREQPPPEPHLIRLDKHRYYDVLAGEDEREGGALLYFHLDRPLDMTKATREYPSPLDFVAEAKKRPRVWIDIEKPFWWDVPVWLASGQIDSIGLANNHMCHSRMLENEAWGRPRDTNRLAAPRGNGFWTQEIYYHILNCGFRLPPSAGSASGVLPNPVGYNRAYVHVDGDFSYDKWWDGLRAGRSFISNGPLLRGRANGELPGHIFRSDQSLTIKLTAQITSADPISTIEVIQDGTPVQQVSWADWQRDGSLIRFERSGWFLIRTIADEPRTFRFGSTAPFYVQIGPEKQRISRKSAQFFLDWVRERILRVKLTDPSELASVLKYHRDAEKFWEAKVAQANAQ